jgi:methionyl-tRNA formyltransferase
MKNLVYFGSPDFSAEILKSILDSSLVNVVGVVTTPDKPQGRKQILAPSPLALLAEEYSLPTYKAVKLDDANLTHLKLLKPDIFLVVSYGKIIPQSWLETPTISTFNIHFSLLPKYRGALCISEAIKNEDKETGVTLMEMDAGLDHGPIITQEKISIDINDNVADLTTKLTQVAKDVLKHNLPEICAGKYPKTPQEESQATFTPSHKTISHSAAFIPFSKIQSAMVGNSASSTHALIRSLNPEPGAWTTVSEIDLKIIRTTLTDNKLSLEIVQMPGKNPISWKQFLAGHPIHSK